MPAVTPIPAQKPPTAPQKVVLAIGLPGAGKSTYFAQRGIVPLSSDLIRLVLYGDAADQRRPDFVFATLRELLWRRLASGARTTYVDATNLTRRNRAAFLGIARKFGAKIEALYFDVPLAVCLLRNKHRAASFVPGVGKQSVKPSLIRAARAAAKRRIVPEPILKRMASQLEPPTPEEGFSRIRSIKAGAKKSRGEVRRNRV
jgi:predicted kinase